MPKRPAPPASASAFPSGTAFRKSASKKRKGENGALISDVKSTKSASSHAPVNGTTTNKGKGKEKQPELAVGPSESAATKSAATKSAASKAAISKSAASKSTVAKTPIENKSNQAASLSKSAAKTIGRAKEQFARFKEAPNEEVKASTSNDKKTDQDMAMLQAKKKEIGPASSYRIVVGSYERLLYGFHVSFQGSSTERTATFETMFSFAAHTSCISAIATAGADSKWLATGAGDETVRVWDLRKKKEVGGLIGHNGTIHSLSFPARTYLLSADSSGLINLYRTRDWSLLKTLRGHTGQVNACVAHPSGRLALSVGKDGMLRMWDLMRGKGAGAVRLNLGQEEGGKVLFKEEPLDVKWNSSGSRFAVMGRTEVVVYKPDMSRIAGLLIKRDDPKRKFGCVEWYGDDVLLTGNEMGIVEVYKVQDTSLEGPIGRLCGHSNRVRAVRAIHLRLEDNTDLTIATTASSDGKIRLFDISSLVTIEFAKDEVAIELQPLATHDTGGARLTCLDVVGGSTGSKALSTEKMMEDNDDDGQEDEEHGDTELGQEEMEELHHLLDLVEEAKRQGVEVDGLSEFESHDSDEIDDDDDDDVYGDSELEGLEGDDDFAEEEQDSAEEKDEIEEKEEEEEDESEVEEEEETD